MESRLHNLILTLIPSQVSLPMGINCRASSTKPSHTEQYISFFGYFTCFEFHNIFKCLRKIHKLIVVAPFWHKTIILNQNTWIRRRVRSGSERESRRDDRQFRLSVVLIPNHRCHSPSSPGRNSSRYTYLAPPFAFAQSSDPPDEGSEK